MRPSPAWVRAVRRLAVTSRPSSSIRARRGRTTPERRLKSVVFPAPFGPMIPIELALTHLERDIGDDACAADVEPEVVRGEDRRVTWTRSSASVGAVVG